MQTVNNVPTVSDTKRTFYTLHTRPINSIYRRVVEELMVEMHLLAVNIDFRYDPIYGLGVVSSFNQFMQGYRPEADKTSIFNALCQSLGGDAQRYLQDAEALEALAKQLPWQSLVEQLSHPEQLAADHLREPLLGVVNNPKFKYSRLFAIGLYGLLESSNPDLVKDEKQRTEGLKQLSTHFKLPEDKLQKDLSLYRSNLEKMAQARAVMEDVLKADRKQRDKVPPKTEAPTAQEPA